ncbi:MAG: zf-HC2 domain-containing protein [Planctomycetota bacterium]
MSHDKDRHPPENAGGEPCARVQACLPLYSGGDLEGPLPAEIRAHLARCPACAAAAAAAGAVRDVLRAGLAARAAGSPGSALWPAVRARLRAEGILAGERRGEIVPAASRFGSPSSSSGSRRPPVLPEPARARGARAGLPRLARWMAAAAAVIFLMVLADPFGVREDTLSPTPGERPGPIALGDPVVDRAAAGTGAFQRVSAEDAALLDALEAAEMERAFFSRRLRGASPGPRPPAAPSLAGETRRLGYR